MLRFPSLDFFFFHSDPFIFIQAQHRYLCYLWEDIGIMTFKIRFTVRDMPHMERLGFVLAMSSRISWGALEVPQELTMKEGRAYNFPASLRADDLVAPISGFCYFLIDLGRMTSQFEIIGTSWQCSWDVVGGAHDYSTVHRPSNPQILHRWLRKSMRETKNLLSQQDLEPYCPEEGRPTVFFLRQWHSCRSTSLLSV